MDNNFKSRLKIGNLSIECTQSFTILQKEYWKKYFGITIEDLQKDEIIATVESHWLNIRCGAGVDFSRIGKLRYKDKVKICETKLVFYGMQSTMQLWGRILEDDKKTSQPQEWICLEYCSLENFNL